MTTTQEKRIEELRQAILLSDGLGEAHVDGHEYKRFEVTDHECGLVFVLAEVGRKDDEGTMASIYARTRRHICIGRRGGLKLLNARKGERGGRREPCGFWKVVHSRTDSFGG